MDLLVVEDESKVRKALDRGLTEAGVCGDGGGERRDGSAQAAG